MFSLPHLHLITFIIIYINVLIFNKSMSNDLGSKYFFINYIYHHHKKISCFLITYPFIIILIYYLSENIFLISSFFISILHLYFLHEIISKKDIVKREAYIYWFKKNVTHSFSMHAHDMFKNDFNFLNERINRAILFKFEIIFFISIVIESEVLHEILSMVK